MSLEYEYLPYFDTHLMRWMESYEKREYVVVQGGTHLTDQIFVFARTPGSPGIAEDFTTPSNWHFA